MMNNENYCANETKWCKNHANPNFQPNADVAGVGALAAFAATSVLTLLAIVAGYFADCFPRRKRIADHTRQSLRTKHVSENSLLNELDEHIIDRFHAFVSNILCFKSQSRVTYGSLGSSADNTKVQWEALERLILNLSDQQLITGLSVLIIGFSQRCYLSSYHFFTIVCMAWFSSTTHLSTLTVIEDYIHRHKIIGYLRLLTMVVIFVLLFIGMVVLYTGEYFYVPAACRFAHMSIKGPTHIGFVVAVLLFTVLTVTWLWRTARILLPASYRPHIFGGKHSLARQDKFSHMLSTFGTHPLLKSFLMFRFAYAEFFGSFMWSIIWLLFWNVWGIRQLLWAKQIVGETHPYDKFQNEEKGMSFGQLLALLLIALPVLTAIEAMSEAKDTSSYSNVDVHTASTAEENPTIHVTPEENHASYNETTVSETSTNPRQDALSANASTSAPPPERNTTSRGVRSTSQARSTHSSAPLIGEGQVRRHDNLYSDRTVRAMVIGISLYTLVSLVCLAIACAWKIVGHETIVTISVGAVAVIFVVGIPSFIEEAVQGFKG